MKNIIYFILTIFSISHQLSYANSNEVNKIPLTQFQPHGSLIDHKKALFHLVSTNNIQECINQCEKEGDECRAQGKNGCDMRESNCKTIKCT